MSRVAPEIFKAYDIRGIVGRSLTVEAVELIGRALGTEVRNAGGTAIAVGRDGRLSGPALAEALSRGLLRSGVDVHDVGMVTTPMAYFAAYHLRCDSAVAVTGSHNPPEYNGLKMVIAGTTLSGAAIQGVRARIERGEFASGAGTYRTAEVREAYLARIAGDVQLARPVPIIVDCGNGVAGSVAPELYRRLGCRVTELYCDVDGTFPNHHPDPTQPENLRDLIARLAASDAELGLAFDGDGDRLGVVTKSGRIIYADRQLMLFAADVLRRVPGGEIIYDVKCTRNLAPWIRSHGGRPVLWKTGHSLIKAKLRELGAPLAGEMSGHIFFGERWYGFDDATYTAARLLEIVSASADPSAVLNALPTSFSTPELNVPCAEGEPAEVVARLRAEAKFPGAREVVTIDGVRVEYDDGFGLVRASNTTPVLVLRFEGTSPEALARIRADCMAALRDVKPDAQVEASAH
jgi:phosphomannomutase/phosphoglucomutase